MEIDPKKFANLATGTIGIYLIYCIASVLQEWIMKKPYVNRFTNEKQYFVNANAFILVPSLISWLFGWFLNRNKSDRIVIPKKNLFYCSGLILLSSIAFTQAIYVTNFPIVMMFKSCNVLSVIFVGIFCSRVRDKKQKLGKKKIISGLLISVGIVLFNFFGTENHKQQATHPWGVFLLMASLICDGFLPDFQAQIKVNYKPSPLEFFEDTNRWKVYISLLYAVLTLQFIQMGKFFWEHPICLVHMIVLGTMGSFGQMLIFWMIKLFRQHTVPFIITTRKIATVLISIIFFKHQFRWVQIIGIILVFITVLVDFSIQIRKQYSEEKQKIKEIISNVKNFDDLQIGEHEKMLNDEEQEETPQNQQQKSKS